MKIVERAIDYPRVVLMIAAVLCALGLIAVFDLPKERAPRIKLPVVIVAAPNPGSTPAANETQIVRKLEDEAGTLKGLRSEGGLYSQAMSGGAVVMFVFDEKIKVADARRDVESLVNRVKSSLPVEAQQNPGPSVSDIGFEEFPIVQVFVSGGRGGRHQRAVAERLQKRMQQVPGVAGVEIFGGLEDEIQIEVDPHRMALQGYSFDQVAAAIRAANADAPSGSLESSGGSDQRVRSNTRLRSTEDIARVPVGVRDGKPIALRDIARVTMGHKPLVSMARYGGQEAVVLLARPKTDIDVLGAANQVQRIVDSFNSDGSAEGTRIGTVRSQAREIRYMLDQLGTNAWQGTVLVVVMLWIAFGWRNATLLSLTFPFCLLATGAMMWVAKKTFMPDLAINNMVLFAMILVVGEVADGSIVIGENIQRHLDMGKERIKAAKDGMREVAMPVFVAYLTTMASFAPLMLVRGVMGEFMRLLPVVTFFSLIAALLVDHFLLPVLSIYVMRPTKRARAALAAAAAAGDSEQELSQDDLEIRDAEKLASATKFRRWYGRVLTALIPQRRLVLTIACLATIVPVALVGSGAVGFELFPEADVPVIEVRFELPLGSSMERRTVQVAAQIEEAVSQAVRPEEWYRPSERAERVRAVTTIGDAGALLTRLDVDQSVGPEFGTVYVELELAENRKRSAAEIRRAIEKEIPPMPGVIVRASSPREGPPAGAPVVVRVLAERQASLEALAQRARQIEDILRSVSGTRDVTTDFRVRQEIVATPDRAVASLFGVDAAQIASSVNYALAGVRIDSVDFGTDDTIDLRLRNLAGNRDQVADLSDLPIRSPTGRIVSLDQVAQVDRTQSAHAIQHYDRKRVVNLRAQLEPGFLPDDIKASLVTALRPDLAPAQRHALVHNPSQKVLLVDDTVVVEFGGENQLRDEAFIDLNIALGLALLGNLVIFVIQFNNFRQPLMILASVPLALVGVAVGLLVWNLNFSVSAMIGIVALSGIVVDNAMVVIEFANKMRAAGLPLDKAVVFATQLRVRPLILTTLTNVVGMIPVALNLSGGGELWQPLAVTIMAGLGLGTIVQLVVVPLLYYAVEHRHAAPQSQVEEAAPRVMDAVPDLP